MEKKNIIIGSDHAGLQLKSRIKNYLESLEKYSIKDVGTFSEESVDYPDIVKKAVAEYRQDAFSSLGILICGTGIGMCITANKFKKINCALIHNSFSAKMAKAHNHVNFLALAARTEYSEPVEKIIAAFLEAENELGRHEKRIKKIEKIVKEENEN